MKKSRLWGGALLLAGVLPTIVVVACGSAPAASPQSPAPEPTPPATPPAPVPPPAAPTTLAAPPTEPAAISALLNPGADSLLQALRTAINHQSAVPVDAAFLQTTKPSAFTDWKIEIFVGVPDQVANVNGVLADTLMAIIKQVWALPATVTTADLLDLLAEAGYALDDYAALGPFLTSTSQDYDGPGTNALASWADLIRYARLMVAPTNQYQYFRKALGNPRALTAEGLIKLNALFLETYPTANDIISVGSAPLFIYELTGLDARSNSSLARTYYNAFAAAYPSANDAELKAQITGVTPRELLTKLGTQAKAGIAPNALGLAPRVQELAILQNWPVSLHAGAWLWKVFVARASDAWGVDLNAFTQEDAKDYLTTMVFGTTADELSATMPSSEVWAQLTTKLQTLFGYRDADLDAWATFNAMGAQLFAPTDHHVALWTALENAFGVTTTALGNIDQVLSTPVGEPSGLSWLTTARPRPIKGAGGRSLFNLYRPFTDQTGARLTVTDDDLYLVPGTYRGRLWNGTKKDGHAVTATTAPQPIPSSVTKKGWSGIWGEAVYEWGDQDSLYVVFDEDEQDGISIPNFTKNFYVVDTGVITNEPGSVLRQYYTSQGNHYEPLGRSWEQWIGFRDGQSNPSVAQDNSVPLDFDAALAKVKTQLDASTAAGITEYYQHASHVFKPFLIPRGLFTYQQVATNAMRVTFHNRGADAVGMKAAGLALTNQIGQDPTTPVKQLYATFAFGERAWPSYEKGAYEFALAKFV